MDTWDVIVIGAGIAGVSAVRTLAEEGAERVLLVNGESRAPYKRTKLSKNIASGADIGQFELETSEWYRDNRVTILNNVAVDSIDAENSVVSLSDGSEHAYGAVILATGAEPLYPMAVRPHESDSYHVLRSADDLDGIRKAAKRAKRILIDGMGVLAVEVATDLRALGKKVTLVGATPQVMPRHLNERAGEIMEDLLVSNGIKLRFQEEILSFERREKGGYSVATIRESSNFDMVIFCIGVQPRTELAQRTGCEVGRGILVDSALMTSRNGVFAAGDCAEHAGGLVTDLWHAAEHQGALAAHNALQVARGEKPDRLFENPAFRLKCEIFDRYFFSVGKPRNPLAFTIEEHEDGDAYKCFYFGDDGLVGVVMIDDRDRAKEYERAVRDQNSRDEVVAQFLS